VGKIWPQFFEVSIRTIYRDIQALSEAGVPIIAVQKKGYSLPEGYFLPPLHFTTEEALILALGSDFIGQSFDDRYRAIAEAVSRKIDAVLPDVLRQEVSYLSANISFFAASSLDEKQQENLRQLRSAIAECRTVHFSYTSKKAASSEATIREVDPYSLARLANDWLLMGYCHLRKELRVFRLGRIDDLKPLRKQFQRPADFKPDWISASEQREIVIASLWKHLECRSPGKPVLPIGAGFDHGRRRKIAQLCLEMSIESCPCSSVQRSPS
jgi:predicted DNA-binding transcriptional regulator YafY